MNIAFIAHDSKKELMIQFCSAYAGVFGKHNLFATGATGRLVAQASGLKIACFASGFQGGDQELSAALSVGEIDVLFFFRDPNARDNEPSDADIMRIADARNIPYATNAATGEALAFSLDRGDFDYLKYGDELI